APAARGVAISRVVTLGADSLGSAHAGQLARLDPLLDRRTALGQHHVGTLAAQLGDRLDELGALVDEADAVVGAVGALPQPFGDELLDERPTLRLGVVV